MMIDSNLWGGKYEGVEALVLGASGFIGRWVARQLYAHGAKIYLAVRNPATAEDTFARYNIQGEICQLDLRDMDEVRALLHKVRPSITFNLAGYGVDPLEIEEETAYQINACLVQTIAETLARQSDPEWLGQDIVHVGSVAEYGAIGGDLSEDSNPIPTTVYGKSKLAGTLSLAQCCRRLGVKGITARLFSVYGPGEHPGRLLPLLLETARTKQFLALTSGNQKRDFTYVEDVAEGLLRLGVAGATPGEIVNLATGQLTPVRSFIKAAARVLEIPDHCLQFGAISMPEREKEWNTQYTPVALGQLRQLTGWTPSTGIEEGIRKTIPFAGI